VATVDPGNAEQAASWDGPGGEFWAAHADRFERAPARYDAALLAAAAVQPGDRVLDVGCGTGHLTRQVARIAAGGSALGIDLSSQMLAAARRRAADEGIDNVSYEQADAQVHAFEPGSVDCCVSRAGTMFFADPVAAFSNIAAALRPHARLALLTWQALDRNEWMSLIIGSLFAGRTAPSPAPDAPGPFSLADPDRVRGILTAAGLTSVELDPQSEPMWFGTDLEDATAFVFGMVGWMLEGADAAARVRALESLRSALADHVGPDGVTLGSAAWIITARRG
jgi:SAM-dependent methyltransferase